MGASRCRNAIHASRRAAESRAIALGALRERGASSTERVGLGSLQG